MQFGGYYAEITEFRLPTGHKNLLQPPLEFYSLNLPATVMPHDSLLDGNAFRSKSSLVEQRTICARRHVRVILVMTASAASPPLVTTSGQSNAVRENAIEFAFGPFCMCDRQTKRQARLTLYSGAWSIVSHANVSVGHPPLRLLVNLPLGHPLLGRIPFPATTFAFHFMTSYFVLHVKVKLAVTTELPCVAAEDENISTSV